MKEPIKITNTDRACELLHNVDFTKESDMFKTIALVEILLNDIDRLKQADAIVRRLAENNKDELLGEEGLNNFIQLMIDADMYVLDNPVATNPKEGGQRL